MSRLRRSLIIQFFSSNGMTAVNFIVSLILARILSPNDIGLFSITVVVANVAHIFRDFGVNSYLRSVKDCTPEAIRAANGVLLVTSWGMGVGLYFIGGLVADYYQQPGIEQVMHVLAIGFLFVPLGATTLALLGRELNAEAGVWINLAGNTSYAVTAVGLAYLDFGYMSMAWANLVNIIATGLAAAPFRPKHAPWFPSLKGWRQVIHFGSGSILGNSVGAFNQALPDIILGKMSGPYDVGLLSRANSTTNIFTQIAGPTVNYAALPHLAKIHHGGESLEPTLCKASAYLTCLGWPALILTAIFSKDVILFLYGPTWVDCVPVVSVLCLLVGLNILVSFDSAALTAIGRPYLASAPEISLLCLRILCIFIFYDKSLISFAWGLVFAEICNIPVHRFLQSRILHVRFSALWHALSPSLVCSLICLIVTLLAHYVLPDRFPSLIRLIAVSLVLVPAWIFSMRFLSHPFVAEMDAIWVTMRSKFSAAHETDS